MTGYFPGLRRKKLSPILAAEAAECGLACLAMVARFHGHGIGLNHLRQRYALSLQGTTLRGIIEMAEDLRFSTRALRTELSDLQHVSAPAILHWDFAHFVVLQSASKHHVSIIDPSVGVRKLSHAEASKHFTGVVLELTPSIEFTKAQPPPSVGISSLWSRLSGLNVALAQVLVLSAALQILAFAAPFYLQLVVDDVVLRGDRDLLAILALGFGACVLVQAGLEGLRNWVLRILGQQIAFQAVGNLVHHLMRLRTEYFEKRHVGDILSRLGSVLPMQDAITRGVAAGIIDGGMALIAGAILFFYSGTLATIVVISVFIVLGLNILALPMIRSKMEEEIIAKARENSHLIETIRAVTTIKLMGREAEREGAWRNLYGDVINGGLAVGKYTITLQFVQASVVGIQTILVVYLAARMIVDASGFSIGMLIAFLSFRQTFTDRMTALVNQGLQFSLLRLHLSRLSDIVEAQPDVLESVSNIVVNGSIVARNIWFRYGQSDAYVLENVNFATKPGEFLAITGASGSGKTTLLKLILGLHKPSRGAVELDGQAATPQLWQAWRRHVGVVVQDDMLLSGTIADNISFFDPTLDMATVQESAIAAHIHEEIMRLPMQYSTLVGDMGSALSAGQRQRVLLARALYRKPKILILDEGTANLDETTEEAIAELFSRMTITRIVVAHRPAMVKRAHRVLRVRERTVDESTQ